jgi:hypothetical protein
VWWTSARADGRKSNSKSERRKRLKKLKAEPVDPDRTEEKLDSTVPLYKQEKGQSASEG